MIEQLLVKGRGCRILTMFKLNTFQPGCTTKRNCREKNVINCLRVELGSGIRDRQDTKSQGSRGVLISYRPVTHGGGGGGGYGSVYKRHTSYSWWEGGYGSAYKLQTSYSWWWWGLWECLQETYKLFMEGGGLWECL